MPLCVFMCACFFQVNKCVRVYTHYVCLVLHRPPGVFEWDSFANGSKAFMDAMVMATERGAVTIIGKVPLIKMVQCGMCTISAVW